MSNNKTDVLIIGGGPSGLAAALCLSRARYKTVIFDTGSYRNATSQHMHMFPTWDHKDPKEYRAAAKAELLDRYYTNTFVDKKVVKAVRGSESGFEVTDESGQVWVGKKLILATGVRDVLPEVEGYEECWGRGIYHCLFCHGYEDRDVASVGVLAIDLMAEIPAITDGLARNALQFTKNVTVYTNGSDDVAAKLTPMLRPKNIQLDTRRIARLVKQPQGAAVKIVFDNGEEVTHGFVVHGPRNELDLDFAQELNLEKAGFGGELKVVNPFQETTEPGCFAVGDLGTMGKLVGSAVALGVNAGVGIVRGLQME